jgi:3-oxoacyl-[acyl-carrier protein] reductase
MNTTGFDGRVALVTGANHGIGASVAHMLTDAGASVFVTYLRLDDEWSHHKNEPALGGRMEAWEADLADGDVPRQLFERAEAAFGPVEILVNNADHCVPDTFVPGFVEDPIGRAPDRLSAASHDRHFAVNSRATALLIAEFARRHIERGATWGRIVGVTTNGINGFPGELSYGASKTALESYTLAAATELGPHGITANVVCPGPTQTGWIPPDLVGPWGEQHCLGRVGTAADVAGVIVWLCSEGGGWVTRNRIWADGGFRR